MKTLFILWGIALICSCSPKKESAETASKDYCKCMLVNKVKGNFVKANRTCINQLIPKYKFLKIMMVNIQYNKNIDSIPEEERIKTGKLFLEFSSSIEKNCCEVTFGCKVDKNQSMNKD